jgi:hypothetical protein
LPTIGTPSKVKQLCETVEINWSSFYAWEQVTDARAAGHGGHDRPTRDRE